LALGGAGIGAGVFLRHLICVFGINDALVALERGVQQIVHLLGELGEGHIEREQTVANVDKAQRMLARLNRSDLGGREANQLGEFLNRKSPVEARLD
jgi:hypothetical protein